jgi:SAM-dependent methyltransferase
LPELHDPAQRVASGAFAPTYDPAFFERLFDIEDRHFWFRTRNGIIATLVRQITASLAPGYSVLEIGCGTGNVLRVLEKICSQGTVIGLDQSTEGLAFARRRTSCTLLEGDARAMSFDVKFDLAGLFDVLEHLPDDVQVLRDIRSLLRPGGALLLTVPAGRSLWSYFDEAARHSRRYELAELVGKLTQAGYRVEYATPYMASLYPFIWLGRRLAARKHRHTNGHGDRSHDLALQELRVVPVVNELLAGLLSWEKWVVTRRRHLAFGTSLLALARRDDTIATSPRMQSSSLARNGRAVVSGS